MATTNDAYCTEADVVSYVQYLTEFDASSVPTQAQMLDFTENRSAELYTLLVKLMGSDAAVGPSGYSNSLDNSTDAGQALEYVLRQYSAIGAAMDCLQAAGATTTPARTERVAELFAMWSEREQAVAPLAESYISRGTRVASHISIGEISEKSFTHRTEEGLVVDGETKF